MDKSEKIVGWSRWWAIVAIFADLALVVYMAVTLITSIKSGNEGWFWIAQLLGVVFIFILCFPLRTPLVTFYEEGKLTTWGILGRRQFNLAELSAIKKALIAPNRYAPSYPIVGFKLISRQGKKMILELGTIGRNRRADLINVLKPYFDKPEVQKPVGYDQILAKWFGQVVGNKPVNPESIPTPKQQLTTPIPGIKGWQVALVLLVLAMILVASALFVTKGLSVWVISLVIMILGIVVTWTVLASR